ncbi:MBL fold metallo-hydrolase [Pelagicoccus mobilis]|uniref:MBL fold metallo-hydrolase n=1 Tax=Pelagicoccus mobilis TaxID=415221 RepID=A0A934S3V3_9BACT|nr:MBL fold metallo-hydrolase [Pelagicoccus mobilis]MBK1880604.1 MBL fold metallo-hydrolase [Pelagicoccus mobilis]
MLVQLQPDLYQIRTFMVSCYLLISEEDACLIDGGFLGGLKLIEDCLKRESLSWGNISHILLTHGHLDHTYNLKRITARTSQKFRAHPLEADHIRGSHKYRGLSKGCAFIEFCGRLLFRFQKPRTFAPLSDKQLIPTCGGIQVLHTPGHTAGHCCFHWKKHDLLFSGDLFATGHRRSFLPPAFLNACPEHFPASLAKVIDLNPTGILSNHCDLADANTQKRRFFDTFK